MRESEKASSRIIVRGRARYSTTDTTSWLKHSPTLFNRAHTAATSNSDSNSKGNRQSACRYSHILMYSRSRTHTPPTGIARYRGLESQSHSDRSSAVQRLEGSARQGRPLLPPYADARWLREFTLVRIAILAIILLSSFRFVRSSLLPT